jgi:hypothetical protein
MPPADMLPMSEIVLERRELHVIWVENQMHLATEESDKRVGSDELNSPSFECKNLHQVPLISLYQGFYQLHIQQHLGFRV